MVHQELPRAAPSDGRGAKSGPRGEEAQPATVELGLLSSQHRQYVMNLVDLERKRVKDIYLPWQQVVKADVRLSAREGGDTTDCFRPHACRCLTERHWLES